MRLAYLNVWGADASETHTGEALKKVAASLGAELFCCRNSEEVEACKPDFAFVLSRTQAKLTSCPTYLAINEPSSVYLREPGLFNAVLTFDGYFALADSLKTFLDHALFGIGRKEEYGAYYNTAPRMAADSAPVQKALKEGKAKLTYFGTNWDARRSNFFRAIGQWDDVEIYGRKVAWEPMKIPAYKGEIAYDGLSVIEMYRQNGIGLNIQGDHHVQEDVISNRVFEITAAGAVCLTCRMPWLEKNFGDTLYYFEQETSDKRLQEQVRAMLDHIRANPEEAWKKAQAARKIFEEKFALEVMVQNLITYHKARTEKLKAGRDKDPLVSVIVKSAGKNLDGLKRALQSVAVQERGRFQIILAKTAPFAHEKLLPDTKHISVETVEGGVWKALPKAKGDYIALLNEAYEWFPQHIARLLTAAANGPEFVHSSLVTEHAQPHPDTAWIGNSEKRHLTHTREIMGRDYRGAMELINPFGFLAAKKLFDERLLDDPKLETGEKEYLIASLMARTQARHTYASTVLLHAKEKENAALDVPAQTALMMRLWRENPHTGVANTFFDHLPEIGYRMRARRFETVREERDGTVLDTLKHSRFDRDRLAPIPMPWVRDQSFFHMGLNLQNDQTMMLQVNTTETMRGLAGFIAFSQSEDVAIPVEFLLVIDAEVEKGQFGVQLLHNNRTLERYSVARNFQPGRRHRLEIPVYYRPETSGIVIEVTPGTTGIIRSIAAYAEK
jgi:hypothetical protein